MSSQTTTQTTMADPTTEYYRKLILGGLASAAGLPVGGAAAAVPKPKLDASKVSDPAYRAQFAKDLAAWQAAQQAGSTGGLFGNAPPVGLDPDTEAALAQYRSALGPGSLGLRALGGDKSAIDTLYNPFQKNVLDVVGTQFGDLRNRATLASNEAATRAGAFGGTRHGVALGEELGALGKQEGQTLAGLQYQGFSDALARAGNLANLGFGAAGSLASLGPQAQMMSDPRLRAYALLSRGLSLPGGGTTTTSSVPVNSNPIATGLGIASFFLPGGGLLRAGMGGGAAGGGSAAGDAAAWGAY